MKFYMEKSLNELKKNLTREYANMTSTRVLEFYRNDNNQLREQIKDLHESLNGIVKVLQNLHQSKQNQSSMASPNLSVNIDENIPTENSSEKSHDIIMIEFSVNKSFSTPNCLHLETPLNFPINKDLNKTKLNDINKTSCSSNIPEKSRNIRSKITENKKLTNQVENIRTIKHNLYLKNRIEIQGNPSKDISMELVTNRENSINISTSKHLTKSTNHKIKETKMKKLNSNPAKHITEETTTERFYNSFDKKDQNAATEALKEKVTI